MNMNLWVITYDSYFMTGIIFILWKIDSAVRCNIGEYPTLEFKDSYHTCGVFATLAFFFINSVSNSRLNDDFYEGVRFNFNMVYEIILKFRDALDLVEQKYGSLLGFFALSDLSSVSLTHFEGLPLYQQYKLLFLASLWILFGAYVSNTPTPSIDDLKYCPNKYYPGVAIFLQVRNSRIYQTQIQTNWFRTFSSSSVQCCSNLVVFMTIKNSSKT